MKISIVLPCYNEEKRIVNTLKQIRDYVKPKKERFEIIVVDDGCVDNTVKVVKKFDPKIKIIQYGRNRGKGYAIKQGMLASTGDITLFMDADASADIREFDNFLPHFKDHDLVVGSREILVPEKIVRRSIGFMGHQLIKLVIKSDIKDLLGGFKAYNKKAKELIFKNQQSEGMASDYEVIFLAQKFGLKTKELMVKWRHQEGGSASFRWYSKSLYELFKVRVNDFKGVYKR